MTPSSHSSENTEQVMRVSASSSASSLASAISNAVYDNKKVVMRAIGAGAVNQAVKAAAIAQGYVGQRGLILSMRPGFTNVQMPDGTVSAIVLRIHAE
jgi:stage V sporulation protein S